MSSYLSICEQCVKSCTNTNFQGGQTEGGGKSVWVASHTTKPPHGGHLRNIAHLENSSRCKSFCSENLQSRPI